MTVYQQGTLQSDPQPTQLRAVRSSFYTVFQATVMILGTAYQACSALLLPIGIFTLWATRPRFVQTF